MKNLIKIVVVCISIFMMIGCSKVPAGHVGIKIYLYGTNKGVDNEVLDVGRYWIGYNEELYLYPTFQQNYIFTESVTEGSPTNEEFVFQTIEGMQCEMDLGVSLNFEKDKISKIFQTYRKGPEEIRSVVVKNSIRDALNKVASGMAVESAYGNGKAELIDSVQVLVKKMLDSTGIIVDKISLIGAVRIPPTVKAALNNKVTATQKAQQRENELREAEAEAKKVVAQAQGEAEANKIKMNSLTSEIIEWQRMQNELKAIEKWDGKLPSVTSGAVPFINVK